MRNKDYSNFPVGYFLSWGLSWHCWWFTLTRHQFSDMSEHENHLEDLLKHSSLGPTPGFLIPWVQGEAREVAFLTSSGVMLIRQGWEAQLKNNWYREQLRWWGSSRKCFPVHSTTDHFTSQSQTTPLKVVTWNCLHLCYHPQHTYRL